MHPAHISNHIRKRMRETVAKAEATSPEEALMEFFDKMRKLADRIDAEERSPMENIPR